MYVVRLEIYVDLAVRVDRYPFLQHLVRRKQDLNLKIGEDFLKIHKNVDECRNKSYTRKSINL